MAIKKLNFSFEVPITALLGLIATGNSALKIDVMGDDKVHPIAKTLLNGAHPGMKLLEGPGRKAGMPKQRGKDEHGKPITAYSAILRAMAKAPDHTMKLTDLRPTVGEVGLNPSTANSQISLLRTRGLVKRVGEGEYQLTARGMTEAVTRGLVKAQAKPKPKKIAKKKVAPVEATPVTEPDNG